MEEIKSKEILYDGDNTNEEDDVPFSEYDVSVSPNDFNIKTIFDFIDSGIVKIPTFQRNFVWDIKRSSKLIESLLIGVPIPQIFLYEEKKNSFLVIDGQQRLMSIYYFKKKRFPRDDKRVEIRQIFAEHGRIPEVVLNNNEYFIDFNLRLPEALPNKENNYNKRNYFTLEEEDRISFDLKTIRNIIIKQNSPDDGDSVVFEIFNRLNSGGVNLKPQEIRTSLYHSVFYDLLYKLNLNTNWRQSILQNNSPDLNMKDIEIMLRGFAMLEKGENYKPSMTKFLNSYSNEAKKFDDGKVKLLETKFVNFVDYIASLNTKDLFITSNNRFNISVFESIFMSLCVSLLDLNIKTTTVDKIKILKSDAEFINASTANTASVENVRTRLNKAKEIL